MSIRIMNWAWGVSLPPTQKLLLLALADNADDSGACWPSLKTLAMKSQVSPRTVQRTIKDFEICGLLTVTSRFKASGRQTTNGYLLLPEGDKLSPYASSRNREVDTLSSSHSKSQGKGGGSVAPGVTAGCRGEEDIATSPLEPPVERQYQSPLQQRAALRWPSALSATQRQLIEPMLAGQADATAQQLLDELASALALPGRIRTTPAQWVSGLLRRHARGEFVPTVEVAPARAKSAGREERGPIDEPRHGPASADAREKLNRVREQLGALADRLRVRP